MSEVQCPKCGGYETAVQRQRGLSCLMLLLGLLLFSVGIIKLQAWFPADNFWQNFIMSQTLSYPGNYSWWDLLKYTLSFAVISSLAFALAGFGVWLIGTPRQVCKLCGYRWWKEDS